MPSRSPLGSAPALTPSRAHPPSQREGRRALVDRAVGLLRPMVETIVADDDASFDRALSVVVMDPDAPPHAAFDEAILARYAFGNAGRCDVDYERYARDKARHSFRERLDTSELRDRLTGIETCADIPLIGGIHRNGWTIGVSGAQPWVDEAVGNMLADLLRMLALQSLLREGA